MTIISILLTLLFSAVSALVLLEPICDISVVFNGIGHSLGLAMVQEVLLLSFLFITNYGIGFLLIEGLLYTHITQTSHMSIFISNLMLQLTFSSIRPSPLKMTCGFAPKKIKSLDSLILASSRSRMHALFSPSQQILPSRIRISYYSTPGFVSIKIYRNADIDKLQIIQEAKGKAGVYR
jgi:hypothetical protein